MENGVKITMALEEAADRLNKAAGGAGEITVEMLRKDIEDGLPLDGDGSLDLVILAAWLASGNA